MTNGDQQAREARLLLCGSFQGVLSTHSTEHEGYPFGSVVPFMIGQDGNPLMLLSHLSQHTKNLDANGRCSLTVMQRGEGDIQQLARLNAIADCEPVEASAAEMRYFDYFPQTRMYFEQLGFRFYRLRTARFHWNGGFATARWFSAERLLRPNPLDPERLQGVLHHMNQDHADAVRGYLHEDPPAEEETVLMVGIDSDGIDLLVGEQLRRVPLIREIGSPDEVRDVLVEMARSGS